MKKTFIIYVLFINKIFFSSCLFYFQVLPQLTYIPTNNTKHLTPSLFQQTAKRKGNIIINPFYIHMLGQSTESFNTIESAKPIKVNQFEININISLTPNFKKNGNNFCIWFSSKKYANYKNNSIPPLGFANKFQGFFISFITKPQTTKNFKTLIQIYENPEYGDFEEKSLIKKKDDYNSCFLHIFNEKMQTKLIIRYSAIGYVDVFYSKSGIGLFRCFTYEISRDILNKEFIFGISSKNGIIDGESYQGEIKIHEIKMFNNDEDHKEDGKYTDEFIRSINEKYFKSSVDLVDKFSKLKSFNYTNNFVTNFIKQEKTNHNEFTKLNNNADSLGYYMKNITNAFDSIQKLSKIKINTKIVNLTSTVPINNYESSLLQNQKLFIFIVNSATRKIMNNIMSFNDVYTNIIIIGQPLLFILIVLIYLRIKTKIG